MARGYCKSCGEVAKKSKSDSISLGVSVLNMSEGVWACVVNEVGGEGYINLVGSICVS